MSRKYNIKWQPADDRELKKAVKNFNQKIDYWEKKDPKNKSALPEKVTVRALKDLIDTRQDLNRELNSLKRFTKKGAEELTTVPDNDYSLQITKWQKKEMSIRAGAINRRRANRLKDIQEIEATQGGKPLGYKQSEVGMGKADEIALKPVNAFTPKMNRTDLKYKFKQLQRESRDKFYEEKDKALKENYIKGIRENYNSDDPDVIEVIDAIENMDFKEFYKKFQAEDPTFEFASDLPPGTERKQYVEQLKSAWVSKKSPTK